MKLIFSNSHVVIVNSEIINIIGPTKYIRIITLTINIYYNIIYIYVYILIYNINMKEH